MQIRLTVYLLALCLGFAGPIGAEDGDRLNKIYVTGEGEVEAVPDLARVSVGVEASARTAREALTQNSGIMTQIMDVLGRSGIAETDIRTTRLSLYPNYARRGADLGQSVVGYKAQNMLDVTVRDLPSLGRLLDDVTGVGGNAIAAINFDLEDPKGAQDAARRAAMADALRKATLYAEAAGIGLGNVVSISEQGGNGGHYPAPMARMEAMEAAVPVSAGQLTITARVSVVYEIE